MYELPVLEGTLIALAVISVATMLLFGVFGAFPRASRMRSALVTCPTIGCRARAELARDEWALRFTDVKRCSVLGESAVVFCNKGCLETARGSGVEEDN
jgi:hypothetical protein